MKDIMQMSWEASKVAKSPKEQRELFTEMLFAEFAKMKSADIAPHLSCELDVIHREYNFLMYSACQCLYVKNRTGDVKKLAVAISTSGNRIT